MYFPNIVKRWKWNRHQNHRFWTFEKCATRACPWPKMIETPLGNSIWINFHVQILRFLRVISSRILWAKNHSIFKNHLNFSRQKLSSFFWIIKIALLATTAQRCQNNGGFNHAVTLNGLCKTLRFYFLISHLASNEIRWRLQKIECQNWTYQITCQIR